MKGKRGMASALISLLIVAAMYLWFVFVSWGVTFFTVQFTFSRMVLPFIIAFFLIWLSIFVILTGIAGIRKKSAIKKERIAEIGEEAWKAEQAQKHREQIEAMQKAQTAEASIAAANAASPVTCPRCGSPSISADKKGFGIGKAVVGAAVAGPIGLVAGNAGAKKVRITCLKCGHNWMAGK